LHGAGKKVNSTIMPGCVLLLQMASKRAIFLRSPWETGCSTLLIPFYLIHKMAIGNKDRIIVAVVNHPDFHFSSISLSSYLK
jgi:hypothetical protein